MTPLRIWLAATAATLAVLAAWVVAPVLIFIALLTAALGLLAAVMILVANRLRAWRERRWPTHSTE